MLSFPSELLGTLREPLKLISATVSTELLRAMGYAVYRQGTFLQLPHITLEVADSCSGLNQLVSSIALGIPLAFTMLNRWWERLFIVVLSMVMGIVMNWVRVVLISIWHYDSAKTEIHGPQGIYELPFIFLVGVAITIAVAMAMSRRSPPAVHGGREKASDYQRPGVRCAAELPEQIAETTLACQGDSAKLANVLKDLGLAASATAAYRLIEQGAVRVDGERVGSRDAVLQAGSSYLLQAGKRGFARVTLRKS